MEFQTRSEENGIIQHNTFADAHNHANVDKTVWKISFSLPETKERIRLVRQYNVFIYEDINGNR